MARDITRDAADHTIKTHYEQDQELAARIGKVDPNAGLNKIPLRVKSEIVSTHERRETIVSNKK
jgi:hypothetical protein